MMGTLVPQTTNATELEHVKPCKSSATTTTLAPTIHAALGLVYLVTKRTEQPAVMATFARRMTLVRVVLARGM